MHELFSIFHYFQKSYLNFGIFECNSKDSGDNNKDGLNQNFLDQSQNIIFYSLNSILFQSSAQMPAIILAFAWSLEMVNILGEWVHKWYQILNQIITTEKRKKERKFVHYCYYSYVIKFGNVLPILLTENWIAFALPKWCHSQTYFVAFTSLSSRSLAAC